MTVLDPLIPLSPRPTLGTAPEWPGPAVARPPEWVQTLLRASGGGDAAPTPPAPQTEHGLAIRVAESGPFAFVEARAPAAAAMDDAAFERAAHDAYAAVARALADRPARHPVRLWNYLPRIHQ